MLTAAFELGGSLGKLKLQHYSTPPAISRHGAYRHGLLSLLSKIRCSFSRSGDQPAKNWFHQWPTYTGTTYKDQTLFDPYAAEADKRLMTDGWFDKHMPDVDQKNPLVKKYITQSHIWWIE